MSDFVASEDSNLFTPYRLAEPSFIPYLRLESYKRESPILSLSKCGCLIVTRIELLKYLCYVRQPRETLRCFLVANLSIIFVLPKY
nr:MAG TPA: hypothetical protein [Caudoviricetes sp.]